MNFVIVHRDCDFLVAEHARDGEQYGRVTEPRRFGDYTFRPLRHVVSDDPTDVSLVATTTSPFLCLLMLASLSICMDTRRMCL